MTNVITEARAKPEPFAQPAGKKQVPEGQRRTILTLTESTCRWPVGDPTSDEFYFCGCASEIGQPYCEHHAAVATQPAQPRRR